MYMTEDLKLQMTRNFSPLYLLHQQNDAVWENRDGIQHKLQLNLAIIVIQSFFFKTMIVPRKVLRKRFDQQSTQLRQWNIIEPISLQVSEKKGIWLTKTDTIIAKKMAVDDILQAYNIHTDLML